MTIRCVLKLGIPVGRRDSWLPDQYGRDRDFPVVLVFPAATQGIILNATEYIIVVLLSTLASTCITPIPSSSLVLTVMIAGSIGVPITGIYAVVVAIDWFLDRFGTAVNVRCDTSAAIIVAKITGIEDEGGETQYTGELNASPVVARFACEGYRESVGC
jgi:L-cystine uptake protein TcyP (sodium:dicarboxylate symporter family)